MQLSQWRLLGCPGLHQLLGLPDPIILLDLALKLELLIEGSHLLRVEVCNLPVVEDARIVEALLDFDGNAADILKVVGFATRRLDPAEGRRRFPLFAFPDAAPVPNLQTESPTGAAFPSPWKFRKIRSRVWISAS